MKKILLLVGLTTMISLVLIGCSSANKDYQEGRKYFLEENYEEAAKHFKEALGKNSNRAEYYIDYGMTLIQLGQYESAINSLDMGYQDKKIQIILENNKKIKRGKAIAYLHMGKYDEALNLFDEALEMKELPDMNMDILFYKGQTLRMLDRFEEARNAYTDILERDENNHRALSQRAYLNRLAGEYEQSLVDYDLAISLKPKEYDYYLGKYYVYSDMGNSVESAKVLAQMTDLEVVTAEDEYNLAKIYFYQGDKELALTKLQDSLAAGIDEAYFYIGELYEDEKNYELAIYNYDLYLESGVKDTGTVYNQIASCFMSLDKYKEAITYLEQGLSINQGEVWKSLKRNEIISYERLGQFDKALERLEELLARYPEDEDAKRELEFLQIQLR